MKHDLGSENFDFSKQFSYYDTATSWWIAQVALWCCNYVHEGILRLLARVVGVNSQTITWTKLKLWGQSVFSLYQIYPKVCQVCNLRGFTVSYSRVATLWTAVTEKKRPGLSEVFGPDPPSLQNRPKAAWLAFWWPENII